MLPDHPISHVCLAGSRLIRDQALIRMLRFRHAVTLVEEIDALPHMGLLSSASVLVLDGAGRSEHLRVVLPALRDRFPDLHVVLIGGGHDNKQVVAAFRDGVRDYFPAPYEARLLAERVSSLCAPSD